MNGMQDKPQVLKVAIPKTKQAAFDYLADEISSEMIGRRVIVPFRNNFQLGIVTDIDVPQAPINKIKPVKQWLDNQIILPKKLLRLYRWMSDYYQVNLAEALHCALPKRLKQGKALQMPQLISFSLNLELKECLKQIKANAHKQRSLLELLAAGAQTKEQLNALGFDKKTLDKFIEKGWVKSEQVEELPQQNHCLDKPLVLNAEQQTAFDAILSDLNSFTVHLLYGVTGSGKTEVYFQTIDKVLCLDKQVLILVPEIGLTPQLVSRFKSRFNAPMTVIHSHLNDSERHQAWLLASKNQAQIIIGTRSAIFTPIPKLGLIIIDEEHDLSFKQMNSMRYSARDSAIVRAQFANIPIILGSATPSLETLHNSLTSKYHCSILSQRAQANAAKKVQVIDCRSQALIHGLSNQVLHRIEHHLAHGKQVLIFINRRGYAPVLLCHQCGHIDDCRQCSNHMTVHYASNKLQCHHCGLSMRIPHRCSECQSQELVPIGAGTQRIADYLAERFVDANCVRIDRDSTQTKHGFEKKLELINSGKAQLLIGTQMLAKGHHFPQLNCVVILEADAGFLSQDFKAIERTGQLLVQVAGRAGRVDSDDMAEVLIQSHQPDNPLLNTLIQQGYDAFAKDLLKQRQQALLPPFGHLALIRAKAKNFNRVVNFLTQVKGMLSSQALQVLGPAPAPLEKKANYFRLQLLIKTTQRQALHLALSQLRQNLQGNKLCNSIIYSIDIDPQDLS